jgi:hypothetical protein
MHVKLLMAVMRVSQSRQAGDSNLAALTMNRLDIRVFPYHRANVPDLGLFNIAVMFN